MKLQLAAGYNQLNSPVTPKLISFWVCFKILSQIEEPRCSNKWTFRVAGWYFLPSDRVSWAVLSCKVLIGKSHHSAAFLVRLPGTYFRLSRSLSKWMGRESRHCNIKTACIESIIWLKVFKKFSDFAWKLDLQTVLPLRWYFHFTFSHYLH